MNFEAINNLNIFLGVGAIGLQVIFISALLLLILGLNKNKFLIYLDKHFVSIGFAISFTSALFSMVYSEVINYLPCYLCWYQRIFLFPLVFIFGIALWTKDRKVLKYTFPLILVGFLLSVYQNLIYYFKEGAESLPCDASGISCFKELVSVFGGYVSIPMLALTSFFALLVLSAIVHFRKNN
jgi:disulfide bond formation protein DsbB